MNKFRQIFILILLINYNVSFAQNEVHVKSIPDLIKQLKPNTKIVFDTAFMLINHLKPLSNDYCEVIEDDENGNYLIIKNLNNITFQGIADEKTEIISNNFFQPVLQFENCTNLSFSNLSISHGIGNGNSCTSSALLFHRCCNVKLDNCKLSGSGEYGIIASRFADLSGKGFGVKHLTCQNLDISNCTQGILSIEFSENLSFIKSNFHDNSGGFDFNNVKNLTFEYCTIAHNSKTLDSLIFKEKFPAKTNLFSIYSSTNINILNNIFHSNKFTSFLSKTHNTFLLKGNKTFNNSFNY